jgi:hypothetical protein
LPSRRSTSSFEHAQQKLGRMHVVFDGLPDAQLQTLEHTAQTQLLQGRGQLVKGARCAALR